MLYLTTCVGFGYGPRRNIARGFSRQSRITDFTRNGSASRLTLMHHGFTCGAGHTLTPAPPPAGLSYLPASPHHSPTTRQGPVRTTTPPKRAGSSDGQHSGVRRWALLHGYGNINPFSIDYASRPRLRPRLTQGGTTWPWNPWSSGGRDSHPSCATHACILTRTTSTARSLDGFPGGTTLPYPPTHLDTTPAGATPGFTCGCHSFGGVLEPRYIVGAEPLDQ